MNPVAEWELARCYRYGYGVAMDQQKYCELRNRAVAHGYVEPLIRNRG